MSNTLHLPGYRVNEYRLVLPLPAPVQDKVNALRKSLFEKHGLPISGEPRPGITIMKCHAYDKMEQKLTGRLQEAAMGFSPFTVAIQGFKAQASHSIFIDVCNRGPFAELTKTLKQARWLMNVPQHDPQFFSEPQLPLAQQLKPMKFIALWMDCEQLQYHHRFQAEGLLLLRRSPLNTKWEVLRQLEFLGRGATVKQGELFA